MQFFLIRELTNDSIIKRIFNVIEVKQNEILLNCRINKGNLNFKIKIIKKIIKILNEYKCKNIILSKNLKQDEIIINLFLEYNIQIINGHKLFENSLEIILEKVIRDNNIKQENSQISIISNNLNDKLESLIKKIAIKFKTINIVTNNIMIFEKIEKTLFEKDGTVILISNNKKKSLNRSNIIVNMELNEEQINKFSIYEKSIIINFNKNIKIHKKRFNGKVINSFEIKLKKNSKIYRELSIKKYSYYDIIDLAEVYINNYKDEIRNICINSLK